jgi:hypothetical protein
LLDFSEPKTKGNVYGEWRMENGKWRMEDVRRGNGGGKWRRNKAECRMQKGDAEMRKVGRNFSHNL